MTREALEVLVDTGHQLTIVTKGAAVLRDLDLIADNPRVKVNVSLPSLDEAAIAQLEPQAPTAAERVEVIEALAAAGVAVQLHAQPWVPALSDAMAMIDLAGGRYPVCFGPLNIQSPTMARTRLARELTQPEINQAYLREKARVGPRPNVTWQMPVWLGTDGSSANPRPAGATSPVARVRWMLHSLASGSHAMTVLEAVSPFVRCHDLSGLTTHPEHPDSGLHRDLLHEISGALDDVDIEIVALTEVDDRTAEVDVGVSGTWARPMLGREPTGSTFEAMCSNRYRFDANGLVVEYWQDCALAPAQPGVPLRSLSA